MKSPLQVSQSHYFEERYDSFERWSSYWHQVETIRKATPRTLLEIGVGTGLCNWYARNRLHVDVTTCDFDSDLHPDVTADVRNLVAAFPSQKFDMAVAFQVLEHLPFEEFPTCIRNLSDIVTHRAAISLPQSGPEFALSVRIRRSVWKFAKTISWGQAWDLHGKGGGQHYWEIGVKGSSLRTVKKHIEKYFRIDATYLVPEVPYHRFFELTKL